MTELEKKIKAKIPGEDTGIEVRRSLCAICSPSMHCGVDCYVKDGKIIRVEGTLDHPFNQGHLCTKGSALRNYIYRKDRIQTPLRRIGERGEGKFEPISWDEAYKIIAENLNRVKEKYSPHAVAFFSGYCKWYRPIFHRFANVFGSVNFGTDDSTCFAAMDIGNRVTAGIGGGADLSTANTFLAWNLDAYYSDHLYVSEIRAMRERGGKVIIIDIRDTPATKNLADIFLKINPGTDGALALGMAKIIIDNGWADMDYVEKYTYGFEQYKELVQQYPLDKVAEITGLDPDDIFTVAKMVATNGPTATNFSASALVHHINGFNSHRAILCLTALTGNFDRAGGNIPYTASYLHKSAGFHTREGEFREYRRPTDQVRIGAARFPLWMAENDEFQAMDLLRQIKEGTPYPVKAVFGMGMNAKMFPETDQLLAAMAEHLDFFVDTDPFMTLTAKYADIVLPACTSVERGEMKAYEGGYLTFTKPVIPPLYESKSDVDILCELARVMDLDDEMLQKGYEASMDWIIDGCGLTVADLKKSDLPVKVPTAEMGEIGSCLENGFPTNTGKFEFYSTAIAKIDPKYGLDPLPSYRDSLADQNDPNTKAAYPFYLCSGARLAHAVHSRVHEVPWLRSVRPYPTCDLYEDDAVRLGIETGDDVVLESPHGKIFVKARVTGKTKPGVILMLHGYTEANVNNLVGRNHLDPYTGYPGFKGMRCNVYKYRGDEK